MRKRLLGSLIGLLASAGLALAEEVMILPAAATTQECSTICQPPCVCACDGCDDCEASRPCWWFGTEYLMWWFKDQNVPTPLITTGPAAGGGVLGTPGTTRIDPSSYDYHTVSGLRLNAGRWFNEERSLGLESSAFLFERVSSGAVASDFSGQTLIAQPFVTPGGNAAIPASAPGAFGGGVGIMTNNRLWGSEINAIHARPSRREGLNVTTMLGFRYLDLDETLQIVSPAFNLPGNVPVGQFTQFSDAFGAHNQFYGGQLGTRFDYQTGRFFINGLVKVGLGSTHQSVTINGAFLAQAPGGAPTVTPGGIYTGATNIGRFTQDEFSVIPELQLNVGYQLRPRIRTYVGYNFLYWSDVVRPGEQIDPIAIGGGHPIPLMNRTDFWAHGVSFGVELRY